MAENRIDRNLETREKKARRASWKQPDVLPVPNREPGYSYHWVRVSTLGKDDPRNITSKLREGWEPVKASDHPEIAMGMAEHDRFKDNIVIGGLMLCKIPSEIMQERNEFYKTQTASQMNAVDNNFMRENDPRMPLFRERSSKVSFGRGS